MVGLFQASILYVMAAAGLTLALYADPVSALALLLSCAAGFAWLIAEHATLGLALVLPALFWFRRRLSPQVLKDMLLIAIASIFLQVGFLFFKSAIPQLVPFYADAYWARADQILLGGYDAWELAHRVVPQKLLSWFPMFYVGLWSMLAYGFPVLVVATDRDASRAKCAVYLFFLSWLVIGNLVALAGASVGPVFYDQLTGTARFAALHEALAQAGFAQSLMGQVQAQLWSNSSGAISFISAFPSMHVAIAAVLAVYIRDRFPRFWPLGDGFLLMILLISVYSGYHYLLDGLFSIAAVLAGHLLLRRGLPWHWRPHPNGRPRLSGGNPRPDCAKTTAP